jgi:chromosome segregation ATPase
LVVALRKTQQSEFEQEREMQSQELSKQSEHYQRAAEREAAERERLNAEATARAQEIVALQEQSTQDRQLISKQQGEIAALQAKMVAIIDQCKTEKQTLITQAKQKINTWIDAYTNLRKSSAKRWRNPSPDHHHQHQHQHL